MRPLVASLVLLTACAQATPAAVPPQCPPLAAPVPVAAPQPLKVPDEATLKQWSHDALDAWDRGDAAAVATTISSGFVHFEGGMPTLRDKELAMLAKRKPEAAHLANRTWSDEHAYAVPGQAVFVGKATEHTAGNDSHGGNLYVGWYTLVWSPEGDAWKLSYFGWQKGGAASERDTWNEIFRNGIGFNKEPNHLLQDTVKGLKPGRALDVAMGQGRNALYLASQGWKVTGIDFSDEGVRDARDAATKRKVALDAVNTDIDTYDFGAAKWDLVTMIYATDHVKWIEKIKPSLRPGGLFVLEFFHQDEPGGDGFATGQLAGLFKDGFEILRDEVVEAAPDWAQDKATLVRFVARKLTFPRASR